MFKKLLELNNYPRPAPKEGELYKVIFLYGKKFEIRYGFYEECDRYARHAEPIEIYPDFIKTPQYTQEGIPFATAIQSPCQYFAGKWSENSVCEDCSFYERGEELLGICMSPKNKLE